MFQSIRRHQKWLWAVITTVVIVSFVVFFSPNQQSGGSFRRRDQSVGTLNGKPISRDDYQNAYNEATLRFLFNYGEWPRRSEINQQNNIVERDTRSRLLMIEKLKEFNITVPEKTVAEWITDSPAFRDRERNTFRKEAYDQFVNQTLLREGLSKADFERFARHEVGIQHLVSVIGVAGKLVTPQEAEAAYRQDNEMVDTIGVFWSSSNYLSRVTMDPASLGQFYTNRQAAYRIQERMQISFVAFHRTNFLAEATQKLTTHTNFDQMVSATYAQRGSSYVDEAGKPMTMDAAKTKIRTELIDFEAMVMARRKAIDFANELFAKTNAAPDNLEKLAAEKGLAATITEPFAQYEAPASMPDVPGNLTQVAFALSPENPYASEPLIAESTVYMIAFHKRVPSEVPPLESIRPRVVEDYQKSKANEMAHAEGRLFYNTLTNSLAQGKTFEEAARDAGLTPIDLPVFSQKTTAIAELPSRVNLSTVKSVAFALEPGKASTFMSSQDGGFILFLQGRVPVSDTIVQAELPEYLKTQRQTRQYEAFNDWFRQEMEAAKIAIAGEETAAAAQN